MALKINQPLSKVERVTASEHDVARINSISKIHKEERQESKSPTFALTR